MSAEAWGTDDEYMHGPDGYVTEEHAAEMVAEAVKSVTEERDALLADLRKCEKQFADECASSLSLEKLNELMTLDYERELAENARLRKALNQIAMSPMSSEYAKGRAAVALQGE